MKIFKTKVIQQNLDLVMSFVKDIRSGDSEDILMNRVGGSVTVSPEGNAGEAEHVEVTFKTNIFIIVSKNADSKEIMSLLNQAIGQVASLGTGQFGPGSLQPVGNLLEASVSTIEKIAQTASAQGTIPVHIPIDLPPPPPGPSPPPKIRVTGTVSGWTVTNDTGGNEIANVSFFVRLDGAPNGNTVETKNEGLKQQIPIKSDPSTVEKTTSPPVSNGYMQVDYNLKTDGYFWVGTISLVHIKEIVLNFDYA